MDSLIKFAYRNVQLARCNSQYATRNMKLATCNSQLADYLDSPNIK